MYIIYGQIVVIFTQHGDEYSEFMQVRGVCDTQDGQRAEGGQDYKRHQCSEEEQRKTRSERY
jgi:hypothetical protein